MISLLSKQFSPPSGMISYQADNEGKYAWFLCTWHPENTHILEEIQAEIKLELIKAEVLKLSKLEIESWMKSFFSEYHWKLHARLRKTDLKERGISLFFGILYGDEICFVQFGRLLCATVDDKGLEPIGKSWKHYHVKTADELELFAFTEADIKVRTHRVAIDEEQRFLVLSSGIAAKLMTQLDGYETLEALLDSYVNEINPLWFVLARRKELKPKPKRGLNRLQISTIILVLITLAAFVYIIFGNRFIDQGVHKLRLFFQAKRVTSLEDLPNTLRLRNADILKIMDKVVNAPARNIQCKIAWTKVMPHSVSVLPVFDLDQIYIASDKSLYVYTKKNQELAWHLALDEEIISIMKSQSTLIISLKNKRVIGIKPSGSIDWALPLSDAIDEGDKLAVIEITNEDDPRIDGSIVVIPEQSGISVIDAGRGEVLSSIKLLQDLKYLSAFDSFDSCFYAVVGNSLVKIELNILN